jgi:hypothetical protein
MNGANEAGRNDQASITPITASELGGIYAKHPLTDGRLDDRYKSNVTPAYAYFGRVPAIIQQRERPKQQTIEYRRPSTSLRRALQHRKIAA